MRRKHGAENCICRWEKYVYYICSAHKQDKSCSPHRIRDIELENIIRTAMQGHIRQVIDLDALIKKADTAPMYTAQVQKVQHQLDMKRDEIERVNRLLMSLYENLADEVINRYWRLQTVNLIVRDRQYIGSTVFGRRVRNQIGVRHQVKARQENWIVVDDRHEPLISKELYQRAQEALGGAYKQTKGYVVHDNPLRKKVYCGVCGYAIVRRGKKNCYYCCQRPRTVPGMECCQENIYEEEILGIVTTAIRTQARYAVDVERIVEKRKKQQADSLRTYQKELQGLVNVQEQLSNQGDKLYEDFFEGKISREVYTKQKAALRERQEEARRAEDTVKQRIHELTSDHNTFVEKYKGLTELDNLTAEIAADLLDQVTIWPDGRIEIDLNYLDETALALEGK